MDLHPRFTWVTLIAPIGGVIIAAAGIAIGLLQYHQNSVAARAKETLEYVKRYYEQPVLDSNIRNVRFWQDKALKQQKKLKEKEFEQYIVSTYRDSSNNGLNGDGDILVGFFENLYACTCKELCDSVLVKHFFAEYASTLYDQLAPYI